jgi:hypothetical protein
MLFHPENVACHRSPPRSHYIEIIIIIIIIIIITITIIIIISRDTCVGIATGYGLDGRGSEGKVHSGGLGIFLFSTASRTAWGPNQRPIQWILGALFPEGKSGRG